MLRLNVLPLTVSKNLITHRFSPIFLIAGLYLLASIALTYPLFFNFNYGIYGYPGDSTAAIGEMGADRLSSLEGRALDSLAGAPFGVDDSGRSITLYSFIVYVLALLRNEVFAYNFFTFVSFPLSALAAYALAYKITRMHTASFIAGLIYAFGPFHQWHARQHFGFDPQWMPLFLLALWHFEERPSWRRALLAAGAYSVAAIVNAYYGYFATVAGIILVLSRVAHHRWDSIRRPFFTRARLFGYVLAAAAVAALLAWTYWPVFRAFISESQQSSQASIDPQPYRRAAWWPFYLSARPWDYLLPSEDHPLFGKFTHDAYEWISRIDRGDWVPDAYAYLNLDNNWFWDNTGPVERTIFLGYTGLALSAYALRRFWKERREQSSEARFGIFFFLSLFVIAVWFSAPPFLPVGSLFSKWLPAWARSWIIPFPVWPLFKVLPMFRAYVRFGVLALLSVAVLAAVGLSDILGRIKTRGARFLLTAGVSALILFEFASIPPFTRLYPAPEVYRWLAGQPGEGPVAGYPWNYQPDRVYQPVHRKPLAGHTGDALDTLMSQALGDLSQPDTAPKLAALGVKYALWHTRDPWQARDPWGGAAPLWPGASSRPPLADDLPGLRLRQTFDTAQVYEVVATPAELVVLFASRAETWISNPQWRWQAPQQTLWIWNPTGQTIDLNVELGLEGTPSGSLLITPELTPPPKQIIVDGALQPNPLASLSYDTTPYEATLLMADKLRLRFESLPILPGESRLTFHWESDSVPQAVVSGLSVQLIAGP